MLIRLYFVPLHVTIGNPLTYDVVVVIIMYLIIIILATMVYCSINE